MKRAMAVAKSDCQAGLVLPLNTLLKHTIDCWIDYLFNVDVIGKNSFKKHYFKNSFTLF